MPIRPVTLAARTRAMIVGLAALAGSGCMANPERAPVIQQPQTPPSRTITSFSDSLSCMDDLLRANGRRDIYITSAGIPDATGKVSAGTKEMLITAVSRMSTRSNAFRFVDFDMSPAQADITQLFTMVGGGGTFTAPNYYIRGAITQLDENVLNQLQGGAVSLPFVDIGASRDQVASVISVDLNIGRLVDRQILPGLSASNSITVVRSGVGADASGTIEKAGLSFNVVLNESEGFHQAVRTLIDLSVIEVLGKLTGVPYWQCLGIEQSNPGYRVAARSGYDGLGAAERVRYVETSLAAMGYYAGGPDGEVDAALSDAIGRYQAENDLIATGRVDFDLYQALLGDPRNRGAAGPAQASASRGLTVTTDQARRSSFTLLLDTDRGDAPTYAVGEALQLTARTTSEAFLYCYYQDESGAVARIFPNRFQPNAFVSANRAVHIPPASNPPFNIRLDTRGSDEQVMCFASPDELGVSLPEDLKQQDLTPLPVRSMEAIAAAFNAVPGATVQSRRIQLRVE